MGYHFSIWVLKGKINELKMGKWWMMILVTVILSACTNGDSGKIDVEKVGKKFDSSAEKLWDSTKAKGKELGNKLKNKLDDKK